MDILQTMRDILRAESQAIAAIPVTSAYEDAVNTILTRVHKMGGKVITSGMGKAGEVAVNIASTLSSTGTPAVYMRPTEAQHGDLGMLQPNDVILLISNSGRTVEMTRLVTAAHRLYPQIPVIVITGDPNSELAEMASVVLATANVPEVCPLGFTPTTSITMMTVIGNVLVINIMKAIGFTREQYALRHQGGSLGELLRHSIQN